MTSAAISKQWQRWGQATAAETEAAVGAHNNQPKGGSDSDRNSIHGGGSGNGGDGGSCDSGSGDDGNGAATAVAQPVAVATVACEICTS